jgi:hypothetical protein
LPYREKRGNLTSDEKTEQNSIFSKENLKTIQQTCQMKVSSKTIETLMTDMKDELKNPVIKLASKQIKVSNIKENREMMKTIDDAISTLIKMIEIIFFEKLQNE